MNMICDLGKIMMITKKKQETIGAVTKTFEKSNVKKEMIH